MTVFKIEFCFFATPSHEKLKSLSCSSERDNTRSKNEFSIRYPNLRRKLQLRLVKCKFIKTTFIKKKIFIKIHFHQKPLSSKCHFHQALLVRGTHHPSKNNIVVLCESVAGRRPATPSHKHGLCPPLGSQLAFLLNIAGLKAGNVQQKAPLRVQRWVFWCLGL